MDTREIPLSALTREAEAVHRLPTPMFVIDSHLNISAANPLALAPYGFKGKEVIGKSALELLEKLAPETKPKNIFKGVFAAAHKFETDPVSARKMAQELEIILPSGKKRWWKLSPVFIQEEKPLSASGGKKPKVGFSITIEDITQIKELEARKRELEALNTVGDLLFSSGSTREVISRVRDILLTVLPHDTASIMMYEYLDKNPTLVMTQKWGYANGQAIQMDLLPIHSLEERPLLKEMHETQKPIIVSDTASDLRYIRSSEGKTRSYIGTPIIIDDQVKGFINLNSFQPNFFTEHDIQILQEFSQKIAAAIKNAEIKGIDDLTKLPNRRAWRIEALKMIPYSLRHGHPLNLLLFDIDHYKAVNDTYGHAAGDIILAGLADLWKRSIRDTDTLSRYGGEEFIDLLPETSVRQALEVAERLRLITGETRIPVSTQGEETIQKTISIGIAQLPDFQGENPSDDTSVLLDLLKQRIDEAMYAVKESGRNGVGVYIPKENRSWWGSTSVPCEFDQIAVYRWKDANSVEVVTFKRVDSKTREKLATYIVEVDGREIPFPTSPFK